MITVEQFNTEFINRHNFTYEDIDFLPKKYYYIAFKDIPEAWVCPIDLALEKLQDPMKVMKIFQYSGFLIIDCDNILNEDRKILNELDQTIRLIDYDLYEQLEDGIEIH